VRHSCDIRATHFTSANQYIDSDGDGSAPFELKNRYLYAHMVDMILADELVGIPDPSATVSVGIGGGTATQPNQVLWPLTDHQGTIKDIVDYNPATGVATVDRHRKYDPFGDRRGAASPTDIVFGYTGKYFDEVTGLQNNWNRCYDPKQGRFISQDPIGFAGGDENLYRYVGNDVTNSTDPSGLIDNRPPTTSPLPWWFKNIIKPLGTPDPTDFLNPIGMVGKPIVKPLGSFVEKILAQRIETEVIHNALPFVLKVGNEIRRVNFGKGIIHAINKHLTGDGRISLNVIDPGGNVDRWLSQIARTATSGSGTVTTIATGEVIEIIAPMAKQGGGTVNVGV
jgi:RHS repeat-associated protein